ncbi:hypothetical protein BSNK01_21870 [Bacillaceae bacterium]
MRRWMILGALLLWGALAGCEKPVLRDYAVNSNNIVLNKQGDTLYIANIDVDTVTVFDTKTNTVKAEIPVGREPRQLTLSPDESKVYVTCMYDDRVNIIDVKKQKVVDSLSAGIEPFGVVTSQDGRLLFVANYRSGTVSVIDLQKKKEMKEIKVGDRPRTLALSADGKTLYAPHYLTAEISVIDTGTLQVRKTIKLAPSPDKADRKRSQGLPNTLEQFVIAPDGKTAWVPHLLTNVDTPIHFEETVFPAISVIDLQKEEEILEQRKELFAEINVHGVDNETMIVSNPYDVAFAPDGGKAYVVMSGSEDLVVFDLARGANATQIVRHLDGDNPRGVEISPDGKTLYVHMAMSHQLDILQTGGASSHAQVKKAKKPIPLIADDPLPPLVREGKTIFFSANSDEFAAPITGNFWMSCASCHSDGDINGLTLMAAKGPRNVPSNILATKTGLFMWDGSRDDFADYILTVQDEMGGMTEFDPGKPLPEDVQHMFDALLAYLQYPDSFPVPKSPYREKDGGLTESARRGKELFEGKANCLTCHGGEFFTDSVLAVDENGRLSTDNTKHLHDIGTMNASDKGSKGDPRAQFANPRKANAFDTPTLRGVWATAPYFHDGSAQTLEEAIMRHEYAGKPSLTETEVRMIADYLRSLE